MSSDSAFSVYSANQSLVRIATSRVYDGHPPLYYYLLHFWIQGGGNGELNVRLLSVVFGLAGVAAAFSLGRLVGGTSVGLTAAVLVATSPELAYYDRIIRMYTGLASLSLVSTYLFFRLLKAPNRSRILAYVAASLFALYSHYYAILLAAAQGLWWGWQCLKGRMAWRFFLGAEVTLGLLYVPWLTYAALTQARTTAQIIDIAPPAQGALGFLEQLWVPFVAGATLDKALAARLSVAVAGVVVLALIGWRKKLRPAGPASAVAVLVLCVIVFSACIFVAFPAAVRPRHLLVVLPLGLVLLAWLSAWLRKLAPAVWMGAFVLILGINGYSLRDMYRVQPQMKEPDAVQMTNQMARMAQPGDLAVIHASWEIGYFESHYQGPVVPALALADVDATAPEQQLGTYQRVWLSIYGAQPRDPRYPIEAWLDSRWPKLGEWQYGPNRLELYARPLSQSSTNPVTAALTSPDEANQIRVEAVGVSSTTVSPGTDLVASLRVNVPERLQQRLTFFLHLTDAAGNRIAGNDSEPGAGTNPTTDWPAGQSLNQQFGLIVPTDTPAGDYNVELGAYQTSDSSVNFLATGQRGPEGHVEVGRVRVQALAVSDVRPWHQLQRQFGDSLMLIGYDIDLDDETVDAERVIHAAIGEDIVLPVERTAYHPGDSVNLVLYWKKTGDAPDLSLFGHILDASRQLRAQEDQPLVWAGRGTSSWGTGEIAVTRETIPLPKDLPDGRYSLQVGLYQRPSLARLPVGGTDHISLQPVDVTSPK